MTPSKDTLEPVSPAASVSVTPSAAPKSSDVGRMRADAVSLDVPVKVHGSRVTDVVRGTTQHTEPFEEETSTIIVFPQGGVLRMATAVSVGQMLVVTNLRSKQDAICRVLKVRAYSNTQAYVEVEFTHRQSGYWGVHFPEDDDSSSAPLPSAQATADSTEKKRADAPVVSSVSVKVEPIAKAPAAPAKDVSPFVSIGSHEEVQPSATVTEFRSRPAPVAPAHVMPTQRPAALVAGPIAPPPVVERAETAGIAETEAPAPSRSLGSLTGGNPFGSSDTRRAPDFGSYESSSKSQSDAPRAGNWMWIAACGAFLIVGLAGGALYFREHPAATPQQTAEVAPSSNANVSHTSDLVPSAVVVSQPSAPVSAGTGSALVNQPAESREPNAASSRANHSAASAPVNEAPSRPEAAPAREPRSGPMGNIGMATLDAHPVAKRNRSNAAAVAPTLPAVAPSAPNLTLPGVLSSTPAAPGPTPPANATAAVGGNLIAPKLVRSVAPIYPASARATGISGNVVIQAQVDDAGNITSMKVLSGPQPLQNAALNAMKQWKYQPGSLNGNAIATQVTVTIRFQQ